VFVGEDLNRLSHARGKFAACLNFLEVGIGGGSGGQNGNENVRGGDGVLNSEIDANAADGRHGVRGIADAEKAAAGPVAQAIDGDGEELDVVPIFQFDGAALQNGGDRFEVVAKGGQAIFLDGCESTLGDDVGALPVIAAVESYEELSSAETA